MTGAVVSVVVTVKEADDALSLSSVAVHVTVLSYCLVTVFGTYEKVEPDGRLQVTVTAVSTISVAKGSVKDTAAQDSRAHVRIMHTLLSALEEHMYTVNSMDMNGEKHGICRSYHDTGAMQECCLYIHNKILSYHQ